METFAEIRAAGKTIIFVSHDLGAVKYFSDRVLYIDHGRPVALGPAEEVVACYYEAHGLAPSAF
jgi:teichoic acid transport system ATP-binding protein